MNTAQDRSKWIMEGKVTAREFQELNRQFEVIFISGSANPFPAGMEERRYKIVTDDGKAVSA